MQRIKRSFFYVENDVRENTKIFHIIESSKHFRIKRRKEIATKIKELKSFKSIKCTFFYNGNPAPHKDQMCEWMHPCESCSLDLSDAVFNHEENSTLSQVAEDSWMNWGDWVKWQMNLQSLSRDVTWYLSETTTNLNIPLLGCIIGIHAPFLCNALSFSLQTASKHKTWNVTTHLNNHRNWTEHTKLQKLSHALYQTMQRNISVTFVSKQILLRYPSTY